MSLKVQQRNILKDPFVDRVHTPNFSSLFLKVYIRLVHLYKIENLQKHGKSLYSVPDNVSTIVNR